MARRLSPAQRARVRQAIRDGHLALMAEVLGPGAIDRGDYDRLRDAGKIRGERLLPQDVAAAAHAIGVAAGDDHAVGSSADPAEFWRRVAAEPGVVDEAEREAVAVVRGRVGEHVRSLGARLEEAAGRAMVDADDAERRRRVAGVAAASDAAGDDLVSHVRKAAADLRRDWLRAVHTEIHNAAEEAKAIAFARSDPRGDPLVFKRPRPDACSFCRLLYLKPDGATPRVFRLSALLAAGTNAGRRAGRPVRSGTSRTEWKAVVGATHPFCQCSLRVLPDGARFGADGRLVRASARKSVEVERPDDDLVGHACEAR